MTDIVVHYSEIGIKGDNRVVFERALIQAIRDSLGFPSLPVGREFGRLLLEGVDLPAEVAEARLARLPGIAHFASVRRASHDLDDIARVAIDLARQATTAGSFRIDARRSWKRYPTSSVEIGRQVGAAVNAATGLKVDLSHPDLTVWIEITERESLLYSARPRSVGGLPVPVSGKVMALLSGGIDSPVAAFKLIRRGCEAVLVHFHNYTRDQEAVRGKILDLARVLTEYQLRSRVWLVPFAEVQAALLQAVPAESRMVAYRRAMLRIAQPLLEREGARAFVTGDSVGQVASQTLDNLRAIHQAAGAPVFSPLIGDDKDEIVALSRRIGTYDISVRPYQDCCSFLVARHPDTRVRQATLDAAEARIPIDQLAKQALGEAELHELEAPGLGEGRARRRGAGHGAASERPAG